MVFFLEQTSLIDKLLEKFDFKGCHPQSTPMVLDHKYDQPGSEWEYTETQMRELVGSLNWISSCTRPDLSFATNVLARHLTKLNSNHAAGTKRILRYLKATRSYGLQLCPAIGSGRKGEVYTDADWAGDRESRKSTTGAVLTMSGCPIGWSSKRQSVVALSTMEAEYIAGFTGTKDAIWFQQMLIEIGLKNEGEPTKLWVDNQIAIAHMKNVVVSQRAKHMDIKVKFIQDHVEKGHVTVDYCPTGEQPVDILTKALAAEAFASSRWLVCVFSPLESTVMADIA